MLKGERVQESNLRRLLMKARILSERDLAPAPGDRVALWP